MRSAAAESAGWQARLSLAIDRSGARTRLRQVEHCGPLRIQRPFHPEPHGACHIYVLHPPGGIAGGDVLRVDAHVAPGSHALLTAPAAQKLYRTPRAPSEQTVRLRVESGDLEWLPQETIAFDGARSSLALEVELDASARFLGWEILCLGRPASDEVFASGEIEQRMRIVRGGRLLWSDRMRVSTDTGPRGAAWGLRGCTTVATLVCTPVDPAWVDAIRAAVRPQPGEHFDATALRGVLVCRFLGHQGQRARALFVDAWRALRPLALGVTAIPPRIWAT